VFADYMYGTKKISHSLFIFIMKGRESLMKRKQKVLFHVKLQLHNVDSRNYQNEKEWNEETMSI